MGGGGGFVVVFVVVLWEVVGLVVGLLETCLFFWVLFARGFGVSFPGSFNAVEVVRARRRFVGVFQKIGYQVSVVGL